MELISREQLRKGLRDITYYPNIEEILNLINSLPTFESRPKGKWELISTGELIEHLKDSPTKLIRAKLLDKPEFLNYRCSICNDILTNRMNDMCDNRTNFCGNCGADMRGE